MPWIGCARPPRWRAREFSGARQSEGVKTDGEDCVLQGLVTTLTPQNRLGLTIIHARREDWRRAAGEIKAVRETARSWGVWTRAGNTEKSRAVQDAPFENILRSSKNAFRVTGQWIVPRRCTIALRVKTSRNAPAAHAASGCGFARLTSQGTAFEYEQALEWRCHRPSRSDASNRTLVRKINVQKEGKRIP